MMQDCLVLYFLLVVIGGNNPFKHTLVLGGFPQRCVCVGGVKYHQYSKFYSLKARKAIMTIYNDI